MKIGFIGLGNMGASLAKAVLQAKTGDDLLLANRSQAKVDAFIADFGGQASSNDEIFAEADVIFLGVKPAQFSELLSQYQRKSSFDFHGSWIDFRKTSESYSKSTPNYSYDAKYPCFYRSRSD